MNERKRKGKGLNSAGIRRLTVTAMLFALAMVLSFIESLLPPVLASVPGSRFGLSNIAVMYALFFLGMKEAFSVAVLKSFFVILTRGPVAGFLSLSGGVLSILIMVVCLFFFKEKISYLLVSILGAVFHNVGQFIAISVVYPNTALWMYLPPLILFGIFAGILTSVSLKMMLPAIKKIQKIQQEEKV